ncbi:MAG: phosphate ABC transporter substrate-binding protein PstS, partial [Burkholderiales bacterium]|nr:phosphate ABC transporter substrate-binding protein PstS [Burkholderiales bacterium]
MKFMKTAVAGLAGIVIAGSAFAADITGAGSTFAAPIYTKWADAYQKATSNKVNYQGIGSSGGIKQIISKTVDFAGSDAPLTDEQLAKDGLFQFPTVIGGILPVVNLKGVKPGEMVLSGPVLADIYLGKIKKWNDPAIQALNPKVKLPDQAIVLVRRADGSGTTFIFSNYLSKVSPTWKSEVGVGTSLKWPATSAGGNGNPGVAAFVQRLPGAIGYVESAYVQQNHMTYTAMKNTSGNVVEPKEETFKAAAAGADWSKSFYQILTDEPGKNAWPIVGATFVLLHTKQDKPVQGAEVLKFFDWSFK